MQVKKNSRIKLYHRFISLFLVCTFLFTMMPYKAVSAADVDMNGVGIYNNVYTGQSGIENGYSIKLYKLKTEPDPPVEGQEPNYTYETVALNGEYQFRDSDGSIVYMTNGALYMQQGKTVKLFDNTSSAFKNFLINNNIARIVITPILEEGTEQTKTKVMEEYNPGEAPNAAHSGYFTDIDDSAQYDPAKDQDVLSSSKVYKLQYEQTGSTINIKDDDFEKKAFTLTPMVDVDLHVQWRDTDPNKRPADDLITFDLSRKESDSSEYEVYPAAGSEITVKRTITEQDSNNVIYTYSVPERSEDNKEYDYRADEKIPAPTENLSNYTIDTVNNTTFVNYSLKDYTCKVNWLDTAINSQVTKNIDFDFISSHFDLLDETDQSANPVPVILSYTPEQFDALSDSKKAYVKKAYTEIHQKNPETGEDIIDDEGNPIVIGYQLPFEYKEVTDPETPGYELRFKKLYEITADGTAKIYSLKPKTANNIPANEVGELSEGYVTSSDGYHVIGENTGVRSNIVDRAYDGGILNMLLTGDTTFEGDIVWKDEDTANRRTDLVNRKAAGNFILYRYVEGDTDSVAQLGTWAIGEGNSYIYKDSNGKPELDKYDNTGAKYIYFAKEVFSDALLELGEYGQAYGNYSVDYYPFNNEGHHSYNGAAVFPNGATVTNSLTGQIIYGVDAKWIAADLQGGTGSITYAIQRYNETTHQWESIDNSLTIDGFSAEQMEKNGVFEAVDKYNENGKSYKYRIVQTHIQRTDSGVNRINDDLLPMLDANGAIQTEPVVVGTETRKRIKLVGEDANGKVTITIGNDANAHKFEVQVFEEYDEDLEMTVFKYEYRLVGDVRAVLNKDWSNIPVSQKDQIMKAWQANVTLQVQRYNYTTGRYEDFDASSGNEGNISYQYKTTADGEYEEHNTGNDTSGQFTVNRNTLVDPSDVTGLTNPKYSLEVLNLPRYDEYGHLNRFTIREVRIVPQTASSPIYSAKIDQDPMLFTAKNIFGDGGERINFHKVWMDDGEEEYKTDVGVHMTSRAMPLPYKTSSVNSSSLDWESYTSAEALQSDIDGLNDGPTDWGNYYHWTESQFTDTLMSTKGIGSRYELVSDGSSPNKFNGIGSYTQAGTSNIDINKTGTGNFTFKLQKRLAGTSDQYTDVDDSSITASGTVHVTNPETYTQATNSPYNNQFTIPNNNFVNNTCSVKLKDLDIYKVDEDKRYPYTYTFSITNFTTGVFSFTFETPVAISDTKEYIILNFSKSDNQYLGNGCRFTVSRSYTDSNNTAHTENNVTGLSAEKYYPDRTITDLAPEDGVYTVQAVANGKNNQYSLNITGLDNTYDYQIVDTSTNPDTVLTTVPGQQISLVYRYNPLSPGTDPLTTTYYNRMGPTKLDYLNNVLNYAQTNGGKMLNTGYAMNDDNVWTELVEVRIGYSYGKFIGDTFNDQTKLVDSNYDDNFDLRDFQEYLDTSNTKVKARKYTLRNDGNNLNSTPTDHWIKMLPAQYKTGTHVVEQNGKKNVVDLTDDATKQNTEDLPIFFDWFAGVYKATYTKNGGYDRYYAVQEIPTYTYPTFEGDSNHYRKLSDLTFQNTRIGITNYCVKFDWKVGSREAEMENVAVKILADYHDGNDPRYVTISDGNGGNTDEIKIDLIRDAQGKLINEYYITNLPKYTTTGEIITYTLEEVKVNDTPFNSKKKCSLGVDQLYYEITKEEYEVNQTSNSDDLYTIEISNYFSGTRDFTVNKVWKDDTNKLKTRTDLYIKFWRHSTNPYYNCGDTQVAQDYLWKKNATDTENHWSYTYKGLAKYDSEGYRYEYYVTEKTDKLKPNDYETYYSNAVHMTAQEVNGSNTYTSQDSVFTIPYDHISANQDFSIIVSGLDSKDPFEETGQHNIFEYRVVNYAGTAATGTVTLSEASNQKVNVTITRPATEQAPTKDVIFKLQRKFTTQPDEEEYWVDVPDFYEIGVQAGGTNYSDYNVSEEAYAQDPTKAGRAYDNGTITNKLKAPVTISVKKLWQNIAPNFSDHNFPIADVFLYANIPENADAGDYATEYAKYAKGYDFDYGGYTILGGADYDDRENALGELMNILQISYKAGTTQGQTQTFSFTGKRTIQTDNEGKILYKGTSDYVSFDNNSNYDGTGSLRLEKYDNNGALINYNIKERAINGYTYRISGDTIINDYNGGDKVQVKVSKQWQNMDPDSIYPTIVFRLYQCYVGKENKNDTDNKLMVYQTFTKTFRNGDWDHNADGDKPANYLEYIFGAEGNKESLYRFSPTGEEFFYYVEEELIGTGKQGDNAQTTGDVIFQKAYAVGQDGNILEPTKITWDKANSSEDNKIELTGEHTGLGFKSDIEEYEDLCFPADLRTGVIGVPAETHIYILQGLPESERYRDDNNQINTHNYTYKVVLCYADGNELTGSTNTVSLSATTPSGGNLSVTVTKVEGESDNNIYFKLMRKYADAPDSEYKPVSKKADKSTLWAAKTNEDNSRPLHKVVDVTNSYHPDESNYMSKLTIDKDWDTFDTKNPLNKEFNGISNYSFKLKRYATNINEKALFKVDTGTNADGVPEIDITNTNTDVFKDNDFDIVTNSFTKKKKLVVTRTVSSSDKVEFKLKRSANSPDEVLEEVYTIPAGATTFTINDVDIQDGSDVPYQYNAVSSTNTDEIIGTCTFPTEDNKEYYGTTITLTKQEYQTGTINDPIKITVRVIDTTKDGRPSKKVEIEGLSIYAQNGMVYTYVVDEIEMNAYHRKDDNRKEKKITLEKDNATGKVTGGYANFDLENELKYFNLNINKVFGAEYKDANGNIKYDKIDPEDYVLYFNDEFVKNLKFTLQRRKKTSTNDGIWSVYSTLKLNQSKPINKESGDYIAPVVNENTDGTTTITGQLSLHTDKERKGQYYYTFQHLPIESVDGDLYEYRVIESSANVGDHVSIYYPANNSAVPTSEKVVTADTNDLKFKVERSSDNGTTYTPMTTSVGTENYSPDENGVITIPNAASGEYNVSISDLPLSETINENTVNYTYRISDITGGINVSVNSTESNDTVSFTVKANTRVKYFANVQAVGPSISITDNVPTVTGVSDTNTYSKGSSEVWRDLYVRNIFQGKQIYIEKRWNDNNNADGLRPEILDVTLHEDFEVNEGQTKPGKVDLTKQLRSGENWGRTILMPKYYYNGLTPTNNVLVSVSEQLEKAKLYYNSDAAKPTLEDVGYKSLFSIFTNEKKEL